MRHDPINPELFARNRANLAGMLPEKAIAVVNANDVLPPNADGTFIIHPNSDLFYLSGIEQEESILVLFPDAEEPRHREILFLREPSEHLRIWEGFKHSKEDARKIVRTLRRKPPAPVKVTPGGRSAAYVFFGEDSYTHQAAVKRMAAAGAKAPSLKSSKK